MNRFTKEVLKLIVEAICLLTIYFNFIDIATCWPACPGDLGRGWTPDELHLMYLHYLLYIVPAIILCCLRKIWWYVFGFIIIFFAMFAVATMGKKNPE